MEKTRHDTPPAQVGNFPPPTGSAQLARLYLEACDLLADLRKRRAVREQWLADAKERELGARTRVLELRAELGSTIADEQLAASGTSLVSIVLAGFGR